MTNKIKPIFDSFQEYIEAEDMVFKTLYDNSLKDNKVKG